MVRSPRWSRFGVFVQVADGVEGLVHLRELTLTPTEALSEVFQVGDEVTVVVTAIDGERRRLTLSPRQGPSHLR
ncbi:hypothetical protein Cme02nite_00630 [Catellatospora methionotrophica]|uniref:S1 motif domain-containing protein n=2 Tax=Catellatospora methionotrophica TaxID=121620 RepID=A0A8J3PBU2_9ACTN|nr:hypothetical protein Cme02nite_00630 [Catellatospora methionotrophica]